MSCVVRGCKSHNRSSNVKLFTFPKDPGLRDKWRKNCGIGKNVPYDRGKCHLIHWINNLMSRMIIKLFETFSDLRVCSRHFLPSDFKEKSTMHMMLKYSPKRQRKLINTAVPTANLHSEGRDVTHINNEGAARIFPYMRKKYVKHFFFWLHSGKNFLHLNGFCVCLFIVGLWNHQMRHVW